MTSYLRESTLSERLDGQHLDLATAEGLAPGGRVANPVFFSGFVDRTDVAGAGILAIADVAASRYADLGLAARLKALDPVVTASGDRLRFESFSACNSVYARLDLLSAALGSSEVGFGTTNVDINQPLRTALATLRPSDPLHLSVGHTELRASSPASTHVERKVTLPDRWVRGLAEVPNLCHGMRPVATLDGPRIIQLIAKLPRTQPPGPDVHLRRVGMTWHVARTPVPGGIPLLGSARIRGSDRVLRLARSLTIHQHDAGATAWVWELPGARLTLALSPDPFRGFSGEGTLLATLTRPEAEEAGRRILSELGWEPTIDQADLARRTHLDPGAVEAGLAWLAASGRLGYDVSERSWFHRELPVEAEKVLRRNPRLAAAKALVAGGAVHPNGTTWLVYSGERVYSVGPGATCTCQWATEFGDTRGPCKHLLAVSLTLRTDTEA